MFFLQPVWTEAAVAPAPLHLVNVCISFEYEESCNTFTDYRAASFLGR